MIERRGVSREVGFHQVEVSVQIVIGGGNPHSRLRLAIRTQCTTRLQRDVHKLSVLLVLIKGARGGIIGHVDIGPSVIVEIGGEHAQPISPICL